MGLSEKEIGVLIEKIRSKYRDFSVKHSKKWFDPEAFEDRLSMALRNRMNLEGFILAEITNFEKVRGQYEKKRSQKPFSEKVDRIIEENLARIKKYPEKKFHGRAGIEISHFYGAGADLIQHRFPILPHTIREEPHLSRIEMLEQKLNHLFSPGEQGVSRIEDHALLLGRAGIREIDIEKDKNNYLKEGAFVLHALIDCLDELMEIKNRDWELPIRFDRLFSAGEKKKRLIQNYSQHTTYGAILDIREAAREIIDDFRLSAFRQA